MAEASKRPHSEEFDSSFKPQPVPRKGPNDPKRRVNVELDARKAPKPRILLGIEG